MNIKKVFVKVPESVETNSIFETSIEDDNKRKIYFCDNTDEILVDGRSYGASSIIKTEVNEIRTFMDDVWEEFENPSPYKAIDLGLPSGLLWANCNVGAESETDYGLYFSWGNIEGCNEGCDFSQSVYNSTPGKSLTTNIESATYDAATANMGGDWRMPTKEEFQELYDNTDTEWTTINGIAGRKFMKKSDHSVYVFFPAAGYYYGTSMYVLGSNGGYWSSSFNVYSSSSAYTMYLSSYGVTAQNNSSRYFGFSVRAVYATK